MTNETQQNDTSDTKSTPSSAILGSLVGVGAAWARYGLALGRASLHVSAKSLEVTSELLGGLSQAIQDAAEQVRHPAAPEPPSGT